MMDMHGIGAIAWPLLSVIVLLIGYFSVRIAGKAGYSPLLGLLVLIPIVNLILLWIFALSDWPVLKGAQADDAE